MTDAKRRFRICHLGPETPGLSQTFVYKEALALKRRGHDVTVVTVRRPENPAADVDAELGPVTALYDSAARDVAKSVGRVAMRRPRATLGALAMLARDFAESAAEGRFTPALARHLLAGFQLADILTAQRCDHLHAHFAHFPTQIAMYAAHLAGAPFTATAHANDIYANGRLLKTKARRAAALIMISEFNRAHLERCGADREKMPIVRCGVAIPETTRTDQRPPGPIRVGSLGRLVEKKGMDTLVAAFARLKEQGVDARLEIVGDGPMRDALAASINSLGLGDRVALKGALPNSQALAWLEDIDVFALACRRDSNGDVDGVPVAMMEAMARGRPAVSTHLSGVAELVVDGETGLLAPPEDAEAIAAAIARLDADTDLRERLGRGAAKHVAAEFSDDVNIERLERVIIDAAARDQTWAAAPATASA